MGGEGTRSASRSATTRRTRSSRWYRSPARPALILRPDPSRRRRPTPARLGGGRGWPTAKNGRSDGDGRKLEFVAQFDFARLPPLDGFPAAGRRCASSSAATTSSGVNFDAPDRGEHRRAVAPRRRSRGRRATNPPLALTADDGSPFQDEQVRGRTGKALRRRTGSTTCPTSYSCAARGAARPGKAGGRA